MDGNDRNSVLSSRLSALGLLCGGLASCDSAVVEQELVGSKLLLPAFGGNDFIVIGDGIPGATVDVYGQGAHIASGSGTEINLTRSLVKDETIRVTQSLPGCQPTTALELTVL